MFLLGKIVIRTSHSRMDLGQKQARKNIFDKSLSPFLKDIINVEKMLLNFFPKYLANGLVWDLNLRPFNFLALLSFRKRFVVNF